MFFFCRSALESFINFLSGDQVLRFNFFYPLINTEDGVRLEFDEDFGVGSICEALTIGRNICRDILTIIR